VTAGKGELVVLIHGLHSSAEMNWLKPGIFAALAADHLVIALDLPGHCESNKPENEDAYGIQAIEDIVLLMDHYKIAKTHVICYLLGGMVVVKLMAGHC
jgi:pimeloyl-ACP methyl ester carboxylesterase